MEHRDYPLGSTFEHEGTMLIVAEDKRNLACNDCWFGEKNGCKVPRCTGEYRIDGKDVVFTEYSGNE